LAARDELLARFAGDDDAARLVREALAEIDREHAAERDRLRALFEEAPGFMVLIEGSELVVTMVNRRVRESPGGNEWLGKSVHAIELAVPVLPILQRVYATGVAETIVAESSRSLPDPGRYFTRTYQPLRGPDGTVRAILVLGHEVTDGVVNKVELERMVALLEEAPIKIAVAEGPELRVTRMNRRMRDLLAGRELVGASLRAFIPAGNTMLAPIERVYQTGVSETFERHAELEGYQGRSFLVTIVAIRDHTHAITGIMVAALELTEELRARRALEEQARHLESARAQAVEAAHAKDQFLAMLGHELRNPLAPMVTALQVMRLKGMQSSEQALLERQVAHLTRLVDDLLDISRITRGVVVLKKQPIELATVVNRALEMTSPLLEQRGHRIESDLAYRGLAVSGDPDRLAQVVANLVTNAAKYSEPKSQIRIQARRLGDRVRLSVADDGAGIAPEMMGTIFEAFVQQPQTLERSRGGLGLGLAIVKNLVEAHGGTVAVHSDGVGTGSTFVIELPAVDRERTPIPVEQGRSEQSVPVRRILIVDDNWEAADILRIALEALGHTTQIARDGESALEAARSFVPDLGLLDIGLPAMDGYHLARLLRADRDIPLVAVTGYGQDADRQRALDAGFATHLVKPVDLHDLARLVDELCAKK
jgi:signal transduction histidine kinase